MSLEIKKINCHSLARTAALLGGIMSFMITSGLIALVIVSLVLQKDFAGSTVAAAVMFNIGAGLLLVILVSLLNTALGYIMGFITAVIYNKLTGKLGGIKIELTDIGEQSAATNDQDKVSSL